MSKFIVSVCSSTCRFHHLVDHKAQKHDPYDQAHQNIESWTPGVKVLVLLVWFLIRSAKCVFYFLFLPIEFTTAWFIRSNRVSSFIGLIKIHGHEGRSWFSPCWLVWKKRFFRKIKNPFNLFRLRHPTRVAVATQGFDRFVQRMVLRLLYRNPKST